MSTDILDAVAAYTPTGSAEWTPERQDTVLAAIVGGAAADGTGVNPTAVPPAAGTPPAPDRLAHRDCGRVDGRRGSRRGGDTVGHG